MRRFLSWVIAMLALALFVGFIVPTLVPSLIKTAHGAVISPSRLIRHSFQQIGLALGSLAVGGGLLLAANWGKVSRWRETLRTGERSLVRRRLFWNAMATVHVATWLTLMAVFARVWMLTGVPSVPLGEMGFWLAATFTVYFAVTITMIVTWLLPIQRHPSMPEWAKWTWGVGIALVPMVGVVFHVRVFRRAPASTPSSP